MVGGGGGGGGGGSEGRGRAERYKGYGDMIKCWGR